jgi:hypothetical protein
MWAPTASSPTRASYYRHSRARGGRTRARQPASGAQLGSAVGLVHQLATTVCGGSAQTRPLAQGATPPRAGLSSMHEVPGRQKLAHHRSCAPRKLQGGRGDSFADRTHWRPRAGANGPGACRIHAVGGTGVEASSCAPEPRDEARPRRARVTGPLAFQPQGPRSGCRDMRSQSGDLDVAGSTLRGGRGPARRRDLGAGDPASGSCRVAGP